MTENEARTIVLDNGSGNMQAGFANDALPTTVFPSLMGTQKSYDDPYISYSREDRVGYKALSSEFIAKYVKGHGVVTNWDDMEYIWHHALYNELRVSPDEHQIFLSDTPSGSPSVRERMTQIMFETFSAPAFFLDMSGALPLYASGRMTGLVVSCGDSVTYTVPATEGYVFKKCILGTGIGGRDLTEYLVKLLYAERRYTLNTSLGRDAARQLKEKLCYVSTDFENEILQPSSEKSFELPDGSIVKIGEERFKCPEVLFDPTIIGVEAAGIHEMIIETMKKLPMTQRNRNQFFKNIVLTGGSTLFEGIVERVREELTPRAPQGTVVTVIAPPEREYLDWIGGSLLTSLSTFQQMFISAREYDEVGPAIIHRRSV